MYNDSHNVCKILSFIVFNSMKWLIFGFLNENNLCVFLNLNNHMKFWYFFNNFFFKLMFFFYVNVFLCQLCWQWSIVRLIHFCFFDCFHSYDVHNGWYGMTLIGWPRRIGSPSKVRRFGADESIFGRKSDPIAKTKTKNFEKPIHFDLIKKYVNLIKLKRIKSNRF